jgi:hypothetical protein
VLKTDGAVPMSGAAVDGINGKVAAFGGSLAHRNIFGGLGAISVPIGAQFGLQVDGMVGRHDSRGMAALGGHLFWRDPSVGLVGVYGNYTHWDRLGGLNAGVFGVEGAAYLGRMTISGIMGVEFGNSKSELVSSTTFNSLTTNVFETAEIKTRFWDKIDFSYYPIDNLKLSIGHRHTAGLNAGALGFEYGVPLGGGMMGSLFAEGRVGEQNFKGIWGGVKVYFGQRDKTLIARHRQDDPDIPPPDTMFSLTGNQSSNTVFSCPPNEIMIDGAFCGSAQ